jgi:hypothetical protein
VETESSLPHLQVPATCPYHEPARSSPYFQILLPEDPSYYYLPICAWVSQVVSFPQVSTPTPFIRLSFPPYALHAMPIKFDSFHISSWANRKCSFKCLDGFRSHTNMSQIYIYTIGIPFVLYNQLSNCLLLTGLVCLVERILLARSAEADRAKSVRVSQPVPAPMD